MSSNKNYTLGSHTISIPELSKDTNYWIKSFSVPGFNCDSISQDNSTANYINMPGVKLKYNPFSVNFYIDEDWNVVKDLKRWVSFNFNEEEQYKSNTDYLYSPIIIPILNNTYNKTVANITIENAFIIGMSDIIIDNTYQDSAGQYTISASFTYTNWRIE